MHAGTQSSGLIPIDGPDIGLVAPEVALTIPGCSGNESSLLECRPGKDAMLAGAQVGRQCRGVDAPFVDQGIRVSETTVFPGLTLSCVSASKRGALLKVAAGAVPVKHSRHLHRVYKGPGPITSDFRPLHAFRSLT